MIWYVIIGILHYVYALCTIIVYTEKNITSRNINRHSAYKEFYYTMFYQVRHAHSDDINFRTIERIKLVATVEPLFNLLSVPLSNKHSSEDFENTINISPSGMFCIQY